MQPNKHVGQLEVTIAHSWPRPLIARKTTLLSIRPSRKVEVLNTPIASMHTVGEKIRLMRMFSS